MTGRLAWTGLGAALLVAGALVGVSVAVFTDRESNAQTLQAATTWTTTGPTPPPGSGLKAVYRNNSPTAPTDNALTPWLQVVNTSSDGISLAPVTVRYWFTKDAAAGATVNVFCDYAWLNCTPAGNVTAKIVDVSPARPKADTAVEVGFKSGAGTLAPGGNTYDIQLRVHKADYSNFDETNDYSYGTGSTFADAPKVTVYYDGSLVWGTEP